MKKIGIFLGVLLVAVLVSSGMAAKFYWETTLNGLNSISGMSDGDRGVVIGPAGVVKFYVRTGGAWAEGTVYSTSLTTNGTNCPAGTAALGVDAFGNAESCWDIQSLLDGKQDNAANLTAISAPAAWKLFYSNGSSGLTELSFGAAGTVLSSNGVAIAPSWVVPATGGGSTTTSLPWDNITSRPTINGVTIAGTVLDNAANYPTFNQDTTGNASTADALSGRYIDWNASSGGASVANRPTINGAPVTGAVLDNASNYPVFALGTNTSGDYVGGATTGGFLVVTGTENATIGLDNGCALNEIPKWNGSAWACATDAAGAGGSNTSFDNVQSGTNTSSTMTVGTGGSLTYSGSGLVDASAYKGTSTPSGTEFGYVAGVTSAIQTQLSAKNPIATMNGVTLSGAMLDNAANYPTFNQSTTGVAGGLYFGSDARGDIPLRGASAYGRLAKGAAGAVLTGNGTDPAWSTYSVAAPGTSGAMLYSDGTNWTRSAAPSISASNMTSFPTLNQSTTGTAAGLTSQYVNWNASSGGTSVANRPTINGTIVTGAVLDNAAKYPAFNQNTSGTAANLSGTPTLPDGTSATTQSSNDNSAKLATTAYVDARQLAVSPTDNLVANSLTANWVNLWSLDTPSSPVAGMFYVDGTIGQVRLYDGIAWENLYGRGTTQGAALTNIGAEPALGNPSTTGFVLTSTSSGTRSWTAQSGGATPTGSSGQIQYNGGGALAAIPGTGYSSSDNSITFPGKIVISGVNNFNRINFGNTGDVASPAQADLWVNKTSDRLKLRKAASTVYFLDSADIGSAVLAPTGSAASLTSFPTFNQNTTGTAANLSGTPALPNGVTATTQSQGDGSGKLATTAYTDTAVSGKAPIASPTFTGTTTIPTAVISGGTVNGAVIGGTTKAAGTFAALVADNVTIPQGAAGATLTLKEAAANGTNFRAIKAPDALSGDVTLLLPSADPAGQVISFATPSSGTSTGTWITPVTSAEPPLGNPGVTGYVLSSTTGGTRSWVAASSGTGDIVGPSSATDNAIALYDGTTGKLVKGSPITIGTDNIIRGAAGIVTVHADNTAYLSISNTGPPTVTDNGAMYYDNTLKGLRAYQDGAWTNIGPYGRTVNWGTAIYAPVETMAVNFQWSDAQYTIDNVSMVILDNTGKLVTAADNVTAQVFSCSALATPTCDNVIASTQVLGGAISYPAITTAIAHLKDWLQVRITAVGRATTHLTFSVGVIAHATP